MAAKYKENLKPDQRNCFPIDSFCDDILFEIFKHLNLKDRKAVSLASWRWYKLVTSHTLAVDYPFVIRGYLNMSQPPLSIVLNSDRIFPHIKIVMKLFNDSHHEGIYFNLLEFLNQYGKHITVLHLKGFEFDVGVPIILENCYNLKVLKVNDIDDLYEVEQVPPSLHTLIVMKDVHNTLELLKTFRHLNQIKLKRFWICETKTNDFDEDDLEIVYNLQPDDFRLGVYIYPKAYSQLKISFGIDNINLNKHGKVGFQNIHAIVLTKSSLISFSPLFNKHFHNLRELTINIKYNQKCFGFHENLDLPPLIEKANILSEDEICSCCLQYFLQSSCNVTDLLLKAFTFGSVLFQMIQSHARQLQRLKIVYGVFEGVKLLHDLLEGLYDLEEIIFESLCGYAFSDLAKFSRFGYLPKLKKLTLNEDGEIVIKDAYKLRCLALKWPNVTSLKLEIAELDYEVGRLILVTWPKLIYFKLKFTALDTDFQQSFGKYFVDYLTEYGQNLVKFKCNQIKNSTCFSRPDWVRYMFTEIDTLEEIFVRDYRYTRFVAQKISYESDFTDDSSSSEEDNEGNTSQESNEALEEDPDIEMEQ